jgi:hypothetical protein
VRHDERKLISAHRAPIILSEAKDLRAIDANLSDN